ncbi:MAG TPA: hypothetical protein DGG94_13210 [Micromonosporaceae bacterium]|nr:hypothetical protein [Micromonosporaceae bacterium]HCU50736.1 hypothetical protein [Micromonosporaceae bacterium]
MIGKNVPPSRVPGPPSWVPAGFKLRHRFEGEPSGGFHGAGNDQVTFLHSRLGKAEDNSFPLMVFVASAPGQQLDGTQGQAGTQVSLGILGKIGTYHDGMWYVDGAALQSVGLQRAKQWRTDQVHSLTIHESDRTVGIRARRDVALKDLIQIARSLDLG